MIQAIRIQALYRGWLTRRLLSVAESYFERYHSEIESKIVQEFPLYECKAINSSIRRMDFMDGVPLFGYLEKAKYIEKDYLDEDHIEINLFNSKNNEVMVDAGSILPADLNVVDGIQSSTFPNKIQSAKYENNNNEISIADSVFNEIILDKNIIDTSKKLAAENSFEHHEEFASNFKKLPIATLDTLKKEAMWLESAIRERIHCLNSKVDEH
mmetsp:Transcript_23987/g.23029  ORF Transcript_23987/g.23029 Transcript_23987/m.23029 type:complete len:212 (-) Transcript_23987:531-1166(-)